MLSKPNVNDLMKKVGSRYEAALAIAKRAREISADKLSAGDFSIKDTVDLAANEIFDEKTLVKIDGVYSIKDDSGVDIDVVISETVDEILKDIAANDEEIVLEKIKKEHKTKKSEDISKIVPVIDEIKEEVKKTKKKVKKDE